MPYIKKEDRKKFDKMLNECPIINNKGELEFVIYSIMNKFMKNKEKRYNNLHDCIYGCIHAGEEYRRQHLDLRENEAKLENGDID